MHRIFERGSAPAGRYGWPWPAGARRRTQLLTCTAFLLLLASCASPITTDLEDDGTFTRPLLGAFVPSGVWSDLAELKELESMVGGEFDVGHWYTSWDHPYDPVPVNDLLEHGRIPLVSWQSQGRAVADIATGRYDDYVREWARQAASAPGTLYVRPFPEMNGDWVPWHGDPDNLRLAWRRLVELFREEGTHNVRWVFSPNVTDEPRTAENRMENYYPGREYVDVLALDGYNWGDTRPYIGWRTFEEVFASGYGRVAALGPQPVWIAEVASTEHGGDKAAWIRDMLSSTRFGRLEAIIWFNENKETDWRIESSLASAEAFRQWFEWRDGRTAEEPDAGGPHGPAEDTTRTASLTSG